MESQCDKISYREVFENEEIEKLEEEFPNLKSECYLDHTGATLYSKTQMHKVYEDLQNSLYSNPHSRNPSSSITTDAIDAVRQQILQHFGTNEQEYSVIFTSGATGAMKLLAESFNFENGAFVYLEECHTSVIGMREIISEKENGSRLFCISKTAIEKLMDGNSCHSSTSSHSEILEPTMERNALLAYPAQCNFSGYKYPLQWANLIKDGRLDVVTSSTEFYIEDPDALVDTKFFSNSYKWYSFLDAASYVGTNPLNLEETPVDFVSVSFYKMFGYPTGLGALIVRNICSNVLNCKKYFGGGTVNISLPSKKFHVKRKKLHERFEDGTISFLSIISLRHGFDTLHALDRSMNRISTRVFRLAQYLYRCLISMKYLNGQNVSEVYSDTKFDYSKNQGGVVTFNLMRPNGSFIGYSEMEQIAYLNNVHLRYGCFCNPGACRRHLGYRPEDILRHYEAGHVCGDMKDLIEGQPTGCIRVSFGYMTRFQDTNFLLDLIRKCWVEPANKNLNGLNMSKVDLVQGTRMDNNNSLTLEKIYVYPIKSCAGFEVNHTWTIGPRGLIYDREWLIVTSSGVPLTQKREPLLCQIKTHIDLNERCLVLSMSGYQSVTVSLTISKDVNRNNLTNIEICNSKVCGDTIYGLSCGSEVNSWLDKILNKNGLKLIRMLPDFHRTPDKKTNDEISLANHSQFLLISKASLKYLAKELWNTKSICFGDPGIHYDAVVDNDAIMEKTAENLESRFRPNFVINGSIPFEEDNWNEIHIGSLHFKSGGPCMRCATICMDQNTGQRSSEPLLTLSETRSNGGPRFGIHLFNISFRNNIFKASEIIQKGWNVSAFTGKFENNKKERITHYKLPHNLPSPDREVQLPRFEKLIKLIANID